MYNYTVQKRKQQLHKTTNLESVKKSMHAFYILNPFLAKLSYLNVHPLEVVSRYRDPQLHVGEKFSYLLNLTPNICKS